MRDKIREKLDAFFDKIPRKWQVLINILVICLAVLAIYISKGAPTTVEGNFRRAEKENMVGPSRIMGIEEIDSWLAEKLVVAETDEGVILYADHYGDSSPINTLVYRPKKNGIMVCGSPQMLSMTVPPDGDDSTVIIFDNCPQAVRAELDMELYWQNQQTNKTYRYQYALSGQRKNMGYFRLDLDYQWHGYEGINAHPEDETLWQFHSLSRDASYRAPNGEFPATVRLYDAEDKLIKEESLYLFPQEGEYEKTHRWEDYFPVGY